MPRLSRSDWLALLLSLLGALSAAWVVNNIYEGVPHIEDEFAYVWQAKAIADGKLTVPSPSETKSLLIPFVVDYNGQRFGKYPPGWPALLAIGVALGLRNWVNPLLAGVGLWFTYRLGKRIFNSEAVGLLAALLMATSPFYLMNSASLLSHALGLLLSTVFALAWLETFTPPPGKRPWLTATAAGLALGLLGLTRPLTALAVALPFSVHGAYLFLWKRENRLPLLTCGLVALAVTLLYPLWQFAVTGDPWLNPYILWWPYDKVGFGPGFGVTASGHSLSKALHTAVDDLKAGAFDIFGWFGFSYVLAPFGLWAGRKRVQTWLGGCTFLVLVTGYLAYWVGGSLFGPRYYYEGLPGLAVLSVAGAAWLGGFPFQVNGAGIGVTSNSVDRYRRLGMVACIILLVGSNLFFYLPNRLNQMVRLFGIGRAELKVFDSPQAQALPPALIFVDAERWMHYAIYSELQDHALTSPFIFAWSLGPQADERVAAAFPERQVFYYYPDEPGKFYRSPR